MRKLKLLTQVSIDGFVADKNGKTDWMIWNWGPEWTWDKPLQKYFYELKSSVDCVLLSRKMAEEGFVGHWAKAASDKKSSQYKFAKIITDAQKVVFSKTIKESKWDNTIVINDDLAKEVNKLKKQKGKEMIAYGGAGFASSLINAGLIDEYHLFVNPTALGNGVPLFNTKRALNLKLVDSRPFECGMMVVTYKAGV